MVNLKWWFIFCISLAAVIFSAVSGLFTWLWNIDVTKLSFVCIGLYFIISPFIGFLTHKLGWYEKNRPFLLPALKINIARYIEGLEFTSEMMMRMAIMGTALGYFFMLSPFSGTSTLLTTAVIAQAAHGLGTIMLVTFVGILCSSGIVLQLICLKFELNDLEEINYESI